MGKRGDEELEKRGRKGEGVGRRERKGGVWEKRKWGSKDKRRWRGGKKEEK